MVQSTLRIILPEWTKAGKADRYSRFSSCKQADYDLLHVTKRKLFPPASGEPGFVRLGQITAADFARLRGRLLADIAAGVWQVVPVTPADFQQAQQLRVRHAPIRSLRTLDALQLAVAPGLHALSPLDDFVCADAGLCLTATAEGLTVVKPEVP
jgi:hypothetical protein